MTTQDVANKLIALCRHGKMEQAVRELYAEEIISIEPKGTPAQEVRGLQNVIKKGQQFNEMVESVHNYEISNPIIAENFFSCTMKMDLTFKGAPRSTIEEICVYQVIDGKIVQEQFFFTVGI
ncbi:MAG: nuclear transport factor 2 family protein [Crocinitomix sp.]|nr:nuclear transport factor 2 family protein [Crocinitomix sp.]